jgi:hypothetical protein
MKTGYAFLTIILATLPMAAQAGPPQMQTPKATGISCRDFRMNADGSWTPTRKVTILGPNGPFTVEPDEIFRVQLQGTTNYGVKIAEILRDSCR